MCDSDGSSDGAYAKLTLDGINFTELDEKRKVWGHKGKGSP